MLIVPFKSCHLSPPPGPLYPSLCQPEIQIVRVRGLHRSDMQFIQQSGDSWMYPYQRTPMGNPYISVL